MTEQNNPRRALPLTVLALSLALAAALAGATFAEEQHIWIQKDGETVRCEGDDCAQMIFIGDEGAETIHRHKARLFGSSHFRQDGGFLGVQLTDLTQDLRDHFGIPRDAGVMVGKIVEDSPAEAAGLQVGDVIVSVDQENVASAGALARRIGGAGANTVVQLEIWRDGGFSNYPVTLGQREIHVAHGESAHKRRIEIRCDKDGSEDDAACEDLADFDCGSDECEVRVECRDEGCSCTVNGESMDCSDLPGFDERHGGK